MYYGGGGVGNRNFISINKLKQTFHIGAEHSQAFNYISIYLKHNHDFSIAINQVDYINSINEIKVNNILERKKKLNSQKKKSHH